MARHGRHETTKPLVETQTERSRSRLARHLGKRAVALGLLGTVAAGTIAVGVGYAAGAGRASSLERTVSRDQGQLGRDRLKIIGDQTWENNEKQELAAAHRELALAHLKQPREAIAHRFDGTRVTYIHTSDEVADGLTSVLINATVPQNTAADKYMRQLVDSRAIRWSADGGITTSQVVSDGDGRWQLTPSGFTGSDAIKLAPDAEGNISFLLTPKADDSKGTMMAVYTTSEVTTYTDPASAVEEGRTLLCVIKRNGDGQWLPVEQPLPGVPESQSSINVLLPKNG